jgi:hypothetical protein
VSRCLEIGFDKFERLPLFNSPLDRTQTNHLSSRDSKLSASLLLALQSHDLAQGNYRLDFRVHALSRCYLLSNPKLLFTAHFHPTAIPFHLSSLTAHPVVLENRLY